MFKDLRVRNEYFKEYRKKNREKMLAATRDWKKKNHEYVLAQSREYKKKNIEKIRQIPKSFEGRKKFMFRSIVQRLKSDPFYRNRKLDFTKEQFLDFLLKNDSYSKCFDIWKNSGFLFKLTPSTDRIDNSRGYSLDNIQIISVSENSKKRNSKDYPL